MSNIDPKRLEKHIHSFLDTAVLVIGDLMLDEYIWGKVRRISPEAPVPVVEAEKRTAMAGGAANTAANIARLGGEVLLTGLIGTDSEGKRLKGLLNEMGVSRDWLVEDTEHPTITKTRIIAGKQHVARVDVEKREAPGKELEEALLSRVEAAMERVQIAVISDYGKQVISPTIAAAVIAMAKKKGVRTIVDPKGRNYEKYKGAGIITPNVLEAETALRRDIDSLDDLLRAGQDLNRIIQGEAILLTRGADGMTLFPAQGGAITIPALARTLFDVTGAGDTVVGTLALALASGAEPEHAMVLANLAAGLVVEKLGTATVTCDELLQSLMENGLANFRYETL